MPDEESGNRPTIEKASEAGPERSGWADPALVDKAARLIQLLSVVVGVVLSVLSFNETRQKESAAREAEAKARIEDAKRYADQRADESARRQAEAARPFLELRQKLYLEAVQAAAVLANPEDHTEGEKQKARKRFRELYVAELSLVEGVGVEGGMIGLAKVVDPQLSSFTPAQTKAYELAHALRDSLRKSWNFTTDVVDNPNK